MLRYVLAFVTSEVEVEVEVGVEVGAEAEDNPHHSSGCSEAPRSPVRRETGPAC